MLTLWLILKCLTLIPKFFFSNKKFRFSYSTQKDGSVKIKSDFIGVSDIANIGNTFSLNFLKTAESLMLAKFKDKLGRDYNEEDILKKHLDLVSNFDNQKRTVRLSGKSKKISKNKEKQVTKKEKCKEKVQIAIELLKQKKLYSVIALQTGLKVGQISKIKYRLQKKISGYIVGSGR